LRWREISQAREGDAIVDTAVMRVLRWYEKEGDALIGEAELVGLELSPLQNLFGEWPEDPLYYACYPVRASHLEELEKYLPSQLLIDLERYEYFVECES
jgi:hypothetical protein